MWEDNKVANWSDYDSQSIHLKASSFYVQDLQRIRPPSDILLGCKFHLSEWSNSGVERTGLNLQYNLKAPTLAQPRAKLQNAQPLTSL